MLVEKKQTCCKSFSKISIEFVKPWEVLPLAAPGALNAVSFSSLRRAMLHDPIDPFFCCFIRYEGQ